MSCYSDHNEDIRTKGSCDLCGGTEPDGPRTGVVMSSELGDNWSPEHHLGKGNRTPAYLRKAVIASVLADLLADPDGYLTLAFGVQPRNQHIVDLAFRLYAIATEESR